MKSGRRTAAAIRTKICTVRSPSCTHAVRLPSKMALMHAVGEMSRLTRLASVCSTKSLINGDSTACQRYGQGRGDGGAKIVEQMGEVVAIVVAGSWPAWRSF